MLIVITGGPSSGKTALIKLLQEQGYAVVPEIARALISEGVLAPQNDRDAFEREILRRQLLSEEPLLDSSAMIFLDNSGILDGPAFYAMDGMQAPPEFAEISLKRYAKVFLLEPLPFFERDGVRFEGLEFTKQITELLYQICLDNDLPVFRIAPVSTQERLALVLEILRNHTP